VSLQQLNLQLKIK